MIAVAWLLGIGLLTFFFNHRAEQAHNPNQTIDNKGARVILKRNDDHHYVFTGKINGTPVVFLLDTGASDVTLPVSVAKELHLKRGSASVAQTANGNVEVYHTLLDTLTIGTIVLHHINALINPGMGGKEVLLGMSALKDLSFTQKNDVLVIEG